MTAKVLDGKALAQKLRIDIAAKVAERVHRGAAPPGLAVVLVGEHAPSRVYVRNKQKSCEQVGIRSWLHELPDSTTEKELLDAVDRLNADPSVNGILVQLPLPKQIHEHAIIRAVHPLKDVDAFHPETSVCWRSGCRDICRVRRSGCISCSFTTRSIRRASAS